MKTKSIILGLGIAISLFLLSCNFSFNNYGGTKGSGNVIKEVRTVKSFNSIEAGSAFKIIVTKGDVQELIIETDDNLMEKITTIVKNGELNLGTKGMINNSTKMKVIITIPELKVIELSGACDLISESRFENDNMEIELSGASEADLRVKCKNIDMDVSGASKLKITGFTANQKIEASGASKISAYELESNSAIINCSGASTIKVYTKESLNGDASGASNIYYKGNPLKVIVDTSGAASISKR